MSGSRERTAALLLAVAMGVGIFFVPIELGGFWVLCQWIIMAGALAYLVWQGFVVAVRHSGKGDVRCPRCHWPNPNADPMCPNCGTRLPRRRPNRSAGVGRG